MTTEIPRSEFARIRVWAEYGMTAAQVAAVYGVAVGAIERIPDKRVDSSSATGGASAVGPQRDLIEAGLS